MKTRRLKVVIPILGLSLAMIGYAGYSYFAARPSLTEGEAIAIVQEKVSEELETLFKLGGSEGARSTTQPMAEEKAAQLTGRWSATYEGDHWLVSTRYYYRASGQLIGWWELYRNSKLIRWRGRWLVASEELKANLRRELNLMSPDEQKATLSEYEKNLFYFDFLKEYRTQVPRGWREEVFGGFPTWVWGWQVVRLLSW